LNTTVPLKEDLKIATVLGVLGGLATAALFPYLLLVLPEQFVHLPVALWIVVAAQSLQSGLLLCLLAFFGLRLGHRVGLDAPWLRALLTGRERIRQPWLAAAAMGVFAGLLILGLDPLFAPHMPTPFHPQVSIAPQSSAWVGFLASFNGGIGEEVLTRLFLMSLVVWLLSAFAEGRLRPWQFWIAIIVAALLFGAGHLPTAAKVWPLDSVVISRTIALNTVGGLLFGWLYWKQGLESAMLAHFAADLVIHVGAPLALG
jgi:membrane protease YdiL (CAAX protease family)